MKYLAAIANTNVFDNCLETADDMTCKRCKASHALSTSNTCESTCATVLKTVEADGGNKCVGALSGDYAHTNYAHTIKTTATAITVSLSCKSDTYTLWNKGGESSN